MSFTGPGQSNASDTIPQPNSPPNPTVNPQQCSTYTFTPDTRLGHARSASHGGGILVNGSAGTRQSALKMSRGHQRAFSHGQITDGFRPTHSRVNSKTDFILPPGHKENGNVSGVAVARTASKGHSRQASRSESIYTLRRSAPPPLWRRLMCFLLRKYPRNEEERFRIVVPNHIVPPKTPRKEHPNGKRPNNKVRTTKYTLLSFLPRNLLEQFHRVANLYFIFIVLLNWFPAINAFGKEIAMVPVLFVLGVSAVKDLFEDRRRYTSDKRVNNSTCRIYNSEIDRYKKVLWKEVRVGDLIHLSNNEVVPADILLLRSSDPNGICYIDTGHLDGETNLKQRQVAQGFVEKQTLFEPSKFRSHIEVDNPTTKIYQFHGVIVHPSGKRVAVGTENLLLRECLLKNTDFIEGIVVYAGHETKAMLNNGGPRYKRSNLERKMNVDVIWCVLILVIICVIGAVGCRIWHSTFENLGEPFISNNYSVTMDAVLTFWTFVIIFQVMIPLSLYVTIEMCKILQVYHIHNNVKMYDAETDKRVECRALNITEDLGQVQYIFSDKTGTLTENRMIFRRCTVAGVDYNHPEVERGGKKYKPGTSLIVIINPNLQRDLNEVTEDPIRQVHSERLQEFLFHLSICNTVVCSKFPHCDRMDASGYVDGGGADTVDDTVSVDTSLNGQIIIAPIDYTRLDESRSITPSPPLNSSNPLNSRNSVSPTSPTFPETDTFFNQSNPSKSKSKLLTIPSINFLSKRSESNSNLTDEQKAKLSASICHGLPKKPIYEAESPDELALVDAAYSYNCRLLERTPYHAKVSLPREGSVEMEILYVLPFDSFRKCMSVVFRHPVTKEIVLYTKGADSTVLSNLSPVEDDSEEKQIINKTQQQINEYGKEGLRVLVMAKRKISEEEYKNWLKLLKDCEMARDGRERKIRDCYSMLETNLTLLGATGIEDRLQEGVPETLSSLMAAGIVIWVLTGDKPETAINIAYSAKLFAPEMELLKLMVRSKDAAERTILFYLAEIEGTADENGISEPPRFSAISGASVVPSSVSANPKGRALVVDGKTLTYILDRRSNLAKPFLRLTTYCNSVLCCRATPLQKAYIVRVVKEELKMRTLAIGDGANDVSMIQTADVGIGICGQEGMQAVMAADFALSKFKYLKRFLLVHGHWSYDRLARMVLFFFCKNATCVFLVFWYQIYCGFSGQVQVDQMFLMLYNLFFTSLPPIAIGVYDIDAPEQLLLQKPYLYEQGRTGESYHSYSFWLTVADSLYQSMAIFFICVLAYHDSTVDIWVFGTTSASALLFTMLFLVIIETKSWTVIHALAILASILIFYTFSFLYNTFCVDCFGLPSSYWVIHHSVTSFTYWHCIILSVVVALIPRLFLKAIRNTFFPDDVTREVLQYARELRRGEEFLVSWSRSTSASSIQRTSRCRTSNNVMSS